MLLNSNPFNRFSCQMKFTSQQSSSLRFLSHSSSSSKTLVLWISFPNKCCNKIRCSKVPSSSCSQCNSRWLWIRLNSSLKWCLSRTSNKWCLNSKLCKFKDKCLWLQCRTSRWWCSPWRRMAMRACNSTLKRWVIRTSTNSLLLVWLIPLKSE